MKIAVTSCVDVRVDCKQKVWDDIREQNPDGLILLGDSIYMDWGWTGKRQLQWPVKNGVRVEDYVENLHSEYQCQWEVPSFQQLLAHPGLRVATIYDDHDFLWNKASGGQPDEQPARGAFMPTEYGYISLLFRRAASCLHRQFREHLKKGAAAGPYPPLDDLKTLFAESNGELSTCETWRKTSEGQPEQSVRIIMLDGRYHRGKPLYGGMLTEPQRRWLDNQYHFDNPEDVPLTLLGTGTTLHGAGESWDQHADYDWFIGQGLKGKFRRTVMLTGDIHRNRFLHKDSTRLPYHEITASGAARQLTGLNPFKWIGHISGDIGIHSERNYALIDILNRDEIKVSFFRKGCEQDMGEACKRLRV